MWDVNDREAHLLLATLNRLRGTDDFEKRARLIGTILEDFEQNRFSLNLLPESEESINSLLSKLEENSSPEEIERSLLQEQLERAGVETERANMASKLLSKPPDYKINIKFVFDRQADYNKAIMYFGKNPDTKLLMELLDEHDKHTPSR